MVKKKEKKPAKSDSEKLVDKARKKLEGDYGTYKLKNLASKYGMKSIAIKQADDADLISFILKKVESGDITAEVIIQGGEDIVPNKKRGSGKKGKTEASKVPKEDPEDDLELDGDDDLDNDEDPDLNGGDEPDPDPDEDDDPDDEPNPDDDDDPDDDAGEEDEDDEDDLTSQITELRADVAYTKVLIDGLTSRLFTKHGFKGLKKLQAAAEEAYEAIIGDDDDDGDSDDPEEDE